MIFGNRQLKAFQTALGLSPDILASLPDAIEDINLPRMALQRTSEQLNIDFNVVENWTPELLAYLVISSFVPIRTPSSKIDILWQNFILCTEEYLHFCFKYFGKFIHYHVHRSPVLKSADEKRLYKKSYLRSLRQLPTERQQQYRAIAQRSRNYMQYINNDSDDIFLSLVLLSITEGIDIDSAIVVQSGNFFQSNTGGDFLSGSSPDSDSDSSASTSSCSSSSCGGGD